MMQQNFQTSLFFQFTSARNWGFFLCWSSYAVWPKRLLPCPEMESCGCSFKTNSKTSLMMTGIPLTQVALQSPISLDIHRFKLLSAPVCLPGLPLGNAHAWSLELSSPSCLVLHFFLMLFFTISSLPLNKVSSVTNSNTFIPDIRSA